MFNSYTTFIQGLFFGTFIGSFVLWCILIAFVSQYKKVYILIHLLMGTEAERINTLLGLDEKRKFPTWLGWYRNLLQITHFMFQGKVIRSIPFTEIQQLYFKERTILIGITCISLITWFYLFTLFTGQL